MSRIAIVGDGPGGLSAALFLAKNGHDTTVYGEDETPMHYAHLYNYLGVRDEPGPEFQSRAREQVADHGATLSQAHVTGLTVDGDELTLRFEEGDPVTVDYVVLAAGKAGVKLAEAAGATVVDGAVEVDEQQRTSVDRVYAVGRSVRPERSQAIISAGAGAVAALDVLSRESGKDVHDWDGLDD